MARWTKKTMLTLLTIENKLAPTDIIDENLSSHTNPAKYHKNLSKFPVFQKRLIDAQKNLYEKDLTQTQSLSINDLSETKISNETYKTKKSNSSNETKQIKIQNSPKKINTPNAPQPSEPLMLNTSIKHFNLESQKSLSSSTSSNYSQTSNLPANDEEIIFKNNEKILLPTKSDKTTAPDKVANDDNQTHNLKKEQSKTTNKEDTKSSINPLSPENVIDQSNQNNSPKPISKKRKTSSILKILKNFFSSKKTNN